MRILKLDKSGHTTLAGTEADLDQAFRALVKSGYAMFLNDEKLANGVQLSALPQDAEILALAPLVGG